MTVTPTARLSSTGPAGQNLLQASGQLTVGGPVIGSVEGANRFEYLDAAHPPVVVAGVSPSPTIMLNPGLFPCGGPPTTTATSTTTTSLPHFLVCDLAPAGTDRNGAGDTLDAGEFGNGLINNADIVQLFRASPVRPPAGSDLFSAMDAAPEDAPPVCGGNGSIVNNDVVLCFRRSLFPALPRYTRTQGGSTCQFAGPHCDAANTPCGSCGNGACQALRLLRTASVSRTNRMTRSLIREKAACSSSSHAPVRPSSQPRRPDHI